MTEVGFYNGFENWVKKEGLTHVPRSQALHAYKAWLNMNYAE